MSQQGNLISKSEKGVEIILTSGETIKGILFAKQYERVSDILNDARPFLPFKDATENMHLIAKKGHSAGNTD